MIKNLTLEQEKRLANQLYYGGGYTQKYEGGGKFFTGTYNQQMKNMPAEGFAEGEGPTRDDMSTLRKGTSWKGENTGASVGTGLNVAGAAVDALDDNPDYDNADVASSTLKYAAMGAAAGPIGAAVGGAVGLGIGLIQKNKFEKAEKKAAHKKEQEEGYAMAMQDQQEFAGYAYGGEIKDYYNGGLTIGQKFNNMKTTVKHNSNKRQSRRAQKRHINTLAKGYSKTVDGSTIRSQSINSAKARSGNIFEKASLVHRAKKHFKEDSQMIAKDISRESRQGSSTARNDARALLTKAGKRNYTNQFGVYDNSSDVMLASKDNTSLRDAQKKIAGQTDLSSSNTTFANGGDIPYIYPEASGPNRIGYGEGLTGPSVKAKSKAPKFKPEVIQAAAKKLNLVPSAPDISARQDQTSIGINYSQEASDAKKAFMEKWDLSEGDFSQIDFTTKEGGLRQYQTGGLTAGAYSHKTNPLTVVDKSGRDTGMELTGGEGVFDKPFMGKLQGLLTGGKYQEAGKAVQNEMKTWKHK